MRFISFEILATGVLLFEWTCSPGDEQRIRETAPTDRRLGQCRGDPVVGAHRPVDRTSGRLSAIVGPPGPGSRLSLVDRARTAYRMG